MKDLLIGEIKIIDQLFILSEIRSGKELLPYEGTFKLVIIMKNNIVAIEGLK